MFKKLFVTFEYNYSDTLGNHLFRIVIKPEDYESYLFQEIIPILII